jgi:hypothetical protein
MSGRPGWPWGFVTASLACFAAGVVAVREESDLLVSATATLVVVVLMWAVLLARFGEARRRRFFWSFALVGWSYLAVSYGPLGPAFRNELATTVLLNRLHPPPPGTNPDPTKVNLWRVDHERWQVVGHCLLALLAGQAGGLLARRIGQEGEE